MAKPPFIPKKFLWVDLEMTGLVPKADVILEIAAEVTGPDLETLDTYEARVSQDRDVVLQRMAENSWWQDYPENREDFVKGLSTAKPLRAVEQEILRLVDHHFGSEPAVLAGNSIYNDRLFIKQWMPELELRLHYRMLDVTSMKMIMQSRYGVDFEKPDAHRAFEDIQASIAELQYYLDWFEKRHDAA
jgi:oligoribonuclease